MAKLIVGEHAETETLVRFWLDRIGTSIIFRGKFGSSDPQNIFEITSDGSIEHFTIVSQPLIDFFGSDQPLAQGTPENAD